MNFELCLRLSPLAVLLIFAFCFGDDIDRAWIIGALLLAIFGMSAVPTYGKKGEDLDA